MNSTITSTWSPAWSVPSSTRFGLYATWTARIVPEICEAIGALVPSVNIEGVICEPAVMGPAVARSLFSAEIEV